VTIVCVASAGASAFFEAMNACVGIDFALLTDRDCEAERTAQRTGLRRERIPYPSAEEFSRRSSEWIEGMKDVGAVITLYDRLLTPPMIGRLPMLNIHPSLLPAFPGMGALAAARAARVAHFGATLHGMTMRLDAGPIVAHVESHRESDEPLERMEKKSFVHKLYLILLAIDLLERGRLRFVHGLPVCDPGPRLENPRYRSHVEAIEKLEGVALS